MCAEAWLSTWTVARTGAPCHRKDVTRAALPDFSESSVPSLGRRIALSIVLLAGFYLTTLIIAGTLFAILPLILWAKFVRNVEISFGNPLVWLLLLACTWIPAALLARGLLARAPRFEEPGKALARTDAPELFVILDDLAMRATTHPPVEVYLSPVPTLAVTERGGIFGIGSRRVLIVGAPLLAVLSVQELKAGLAHELGHYLGGETRLAGVVGYTHTLFRSVLVAMHSGGRDESNIYFSAAQAISRALGSFIVGGYASLYLRLTRPLDRRMELAADVLSARLAGPTAAIRTLETVALLVPQYELYLQQHVGFVLSHGAMPSGLRLESSRAREAAWYSRGDRHRDARSPRASSGPRARRGRA
jgi:heat shock protein HtpX